MANECVISYLIKEGQYCQSIRFIFGHIKVLIFIRVIVDHMKLSNIPGHKNECQVILGDSRNKTQFS